MQRVHYDIHIDAPVSRVWDTMFDAEKYKEWTKPFNPGSRFEGSWEEGSEIRFLGSDEAGNSDAGGMFSRIRENRLHEFMSIEHIGIIENGVVDTTSEKVKKWTPATEEYTFVERDGGTDLSVDMDIDESEVENFEGLWKQALDALKKLSEQD